MKTTFFSAAVLMVLAALPAVQGHIEMVDPPPYKSKKNPHAIKLQQIDYDMVSNLAATGVNFPCKGYHKLDAAHLLPVGKKWTAGPQSIKVEGNARHGGGSCQFSVSEDNGETFRVIGSIEGGCLANGQQYVLKFVVPKDVKKGKQIFAWTWYNAIGNREIYMNCASIDFDTSGEGLGKDPIKYPEILKANINNGCATVDGTDVKFPFPGIMAPPQDNSSPPSKLTPPKGDCAGKNKPKRKPRRAISV